MTGSQPPGFVFAMTELTLGRFTLPLHAPLIMGIVNLTPDSFSGDGLSADVDRAIAHARQQREAGADILDLGAESSRPGADPVCEADELARLLPVLEEVLTWGVPVSVDTYKPGVMARVLALGVDLINDINALRAPGALAALAASRASVCLMHMQGEPGSMQQAPAYGDVVQEVGDFLAGRVAACRAAGVGDERLILDQGFGFGKTLDHNVALFRALPALRRTLALPWLVGVSRKSMLGGITGQPVGDRLAASVSAAVVAAGLGAQILRVHDVAETRDALKVWACLGK